MDQRIKCYNIHQDNINEIKQAMSEYIEQLCLPRKNKEEIQNTDFYRNNPAYYLNYPYLFLKKISKDHKIVKLCIASALYYQSIIYIDRVLDKDVHLSEVFLIISICTEETIKILSSFFSSNSTFWEIWNIRKFEFLQAYRDDKRGQINTNETFLIHSDRKSAFGKLAIDALYYMSLINHDEYKAYLQIHKFFYGAFQILDDISDLREDYQKKQFNIALAEVMKNRQESKALKSGEAISEVFYTKRLYTRLFTLAREYVDKARFIASQYGLHYMVEECDKLWNTTVIQQQNVNTYLYQLNVIKNLSKERHSNLNIESVCNSALAFIEKNQESNGSWIDFCNNAGASDCWCTAFTTFMLEHCKQASELVKKSKSYLRKNIQAHLWGYSRIWIGDNDSSIMALLATKDYKYIYKLIHRFNSDGGVPTYYDDNQLLSSLLYFHQCNDNIGGWRQSHPDVSATALYLLSKASYSGVEIERLILYIKNRIKNNQSMVYWWIDDIYTLFFLSLANSIIQDQEIYYYILRRTEEKLQRFSDTANKEELTIFFIAMLLHLLLYCGKINEAKQVAQVLMNFQYTDGSWPESDFMCVPTADCLMPTNTASWKICDHGINVRAHEFHRIYTTSLALMTLSEYMSYNDKEL